MAHGPLKFVSLSDHQRATCIEGPWITIHNAVETRRLAFAEHATRGYLAFIGRLTANKGPHLAIQVARRIGLPLKIAGNVSDEEGGQEFFEREVRPNLGGEIEWIGEIGDPEKSAFFGGARALLVPIRWDEPFGIVVPEALACGTPVIAAPRGSMPELIRDGVNGFLASSIDQMVEAVARIDEISRRACRQDAEERFSADTMVEKYLAVIRGLVAGRKNRPEENSSLQTSVT